MEGRAERVTADSIPPLLQDLYKKKKYGIGLDIGNLFNGVYRVGPSAVYSWMEKDIPRTVIR